VTCVVASKRRQGGKVEPPDLSEQALDSGQEASEQERAGRER